MRVLYEKGVANHLGPESCAGVREGEREVLTGETMGQVLSCEIKRSEVLMLLSEAEDYTATRAIGQRAVDLAQSETLSTWRRSLTGTWEISFTPGQVYPGRLAKARAVRSTCTWVRGRTRSYYR